MSRSYCPRPPRCARSSLCALLAQPVPFDGQLLTDRTGQVVRPAVSIGIARAADLSDAAGASRILRGADMTMYLVKSGRESAGYVAMRHDAYTAAVHGRPGTHLPAA
ncbi:hypothetical protein AB0H69_49235 [Streptomyces phaeochromogenes]|uniref:hypothetical protein n=1 Tax=Streptomyces phaeochromogenes TaxID=1923 RepID=UPI0033C500CE